MKACMYVCCVYVAHLGSSPKSRPVTPSRHLFIWDAQLHVSKKRGVMWIPGPLPLDCTASLSLPTSSRSPEAPHSVPSRHEAPTSPRCVLHTTTTQERTCQGLRPTSRFSTNVGVRFQPGEAGEHIQKTWSRPTEKNPKKQKTKKSEKRTLFPQEKNTRYFFSCCLAPTHSSWQLQINIHERDLLARATLSYRQFR